MLDVAPATEKETASLDVNVNGKTCRLILTDKMVRMHAEKSIFQDATKMIPLSAIDSFFYGWKRYKTLLGVGILLTLFGLGAMSGRSSAGGMVILLIGIASLIAFWFLRPGLVLVRSSRESIGGTPLSEKDAQDFLTKISAAVAEARK